MNSEQFCYWLQGYFELLGEDTSLTKRQARAIKDHLELVFEKVTPDRTTTEEGSGSPANVSSSLLPIPQRRKKISKEIREKLRELGDFRTYCSGMPSRINSIKFC